MKYVGACGGTEGDSGKKAGKWVRERTTKWKRRKKRVVMQDGGRDTRGRSRRGMEIG